MRVNEIGQLCELSVIVNELILVNDLHDVLGLVYILGGVINLNV